MANKLPSFVQLLPAKRNALMPWKNGHGLTSEIALAPVGASLEKLDFSWRLSTAEMREPGIFSRFVGFERLLTLVSGAELLLRFAHPGRAPAAVRAGSFLRFSGAEEVSYELPGGSVKDLGLIFRPEEFQVEPHFLEVGARCRSFALRSGVLLFYVLGGRFRATTFPGEALCRLDEGDVLRVEGDVRSEPEERIVLWETLAGAGSLAAFHLSPIARLK